MFHPIGFLGDGAEFAFGEVAPALADGGQGQDFRLDVRGEVDQVHNLGDAGLAYSGEFRQGVEVRDVASAHQLVVAQREGKQAADARHVAGFFRRRFLFAPDPFAVAQNERFFNCQRHGFLQNR